MQNANILTTRGLTVQAVEIITESKAALAIFKSKINFKLIYEYVNTVNSSANHNCIKFTYYEKSQRQQKRLQGKNYSQNKVLPTEWT